MRRTIARGGPRAARTSAAAWRRRPISPRLVGPLVDIASQHDQQSLTDPESQLAILDAFAENAALRDEMAAAYAARAAAAAALAAFSADARARAEREDLLRFQLGELEAARPVPGEDAGAGRRARAPARRRAVLRGDRGRRGDAVRGRRRRQRADRRRCCASSSRWRRWIRRWRRRSSGCATRRPRSRTWRAISAATRAACAPIRRGWRRSRSGCSCCQRLCRKHGGTVADLAARRDALRRRAGRGRSLRRGAGRAPGGGRRRRTRAPTRRPAALSASRKQAARSLEKKVDATLRELGFAQRPAAGRARAARAGADGRRSGALPVRAQPGRRAAPAREDRLGRRAVAGDAGGQAGAGADRRGADLRLRRGRRGRRRRRRRGDRPQAQADRGRPAGHRHHPPRRRWRRSPTRTCASPRRQRAARRASRSSRSPTASAPAEIARMLAGAAPSPQAAAHADEMLRAARDA